MNEPIPTEERQAALSHAGTPSHLHTLAELIARFASGRISYQDYQAELGSWWENNRAAWQEGDLARLFRLICRIG